MRWTVRWSNIRHTRASVERNEAIFLLGYRVAFDVMWDSIIPGDLQQIALTFKDVDLLSAPYIAHRNARARAN
ncbi:MAG TPA: hypothetical protein VJQ82_12575 [Terriglobales bacterium]|nr:hypothetical protein [Terriglobales bacterium]